jgi:diguanylate cyclase (GGDEF)-like protein/putative nucleotidyltransferase with HDIG domain
MTVRVASFASLSVVACAALIAFCGGVAFGRRRCAALRAERDADEAMLRTGDRLLDRLGLYLYEGYQSPAGEFVETSTGAGIERILGVPLPPGADPEAFWFAHVHDDDREVYADWAAQGDQDVYAADYRIVRASGEVRWVTEWSFVQGRDDAGNMHVAGVIVDTTDRRADQERLSDLEQRLRHVLASVELVAGTLELHPDGTIAEAFRGPGLEVLVAGEPDADEDGIGALLPLAEPRDARRLRAALAAVRRGRARALRIALTDRAGRRRHVSVRLHPRPEQRDGTTFADYLLADVSEEELAASALRAARDEAERRLRVDALTGVWNRVHASEVLDAIAGSGMPRSVVLLDIDHFKRVNDVHLHVAGDVVLCEVAARLVATVEPGGMVARWGGEEFLVALPPGVEGAAALRAAEALRVAVADQAVRAIGDDLELTISAGVAAFEPGASVGDVIGAADRALYAAKRRGRNQIVCAEELGAGDVIANDPEVVRLAEAMSRAASVREGESFLHCAHVADLAGAVARELGLGATAQLRVRLAGLLHDVGKVAVPDAILTKPAPLDGTELEVMRHHAAFGAEIVSRIGGLADTAAAVRHHHERLDGRGYPDGLTGDDIPLEARILAAVDAYSAMIEHRVYRPALSVDEALAELRRAAGSQLDPAVTAALTAVVERSRSEPDARAA